MCRSNEGRSHATPLRGRHSECRRHRLAFTGLDHHEARTVEGYLGGLVRAALNVRPILKVLLIRGCRFTGWQSAVCGATKVDRW